MTPYQQNQLKNIVRITNRILTKENVEVKEELHKILDMVKSMTESEVTDLRPKILKNLAKEFVDKWENIGETAAAAWLYPKVDKGEYDRIRELVEIEFLDRGYVIPGKDKNNE
jgi:Asp-tRNA(Asn)/Glu-tRNA(Gln) amidotransferase C subunit